MIKHCSCGSGNPRREKYDARGIFLTFVCNDCEQAKLARFRPDIFTNPNYLTDEAIEENFSAER